MKTLREVAARPGRPVSLDRTAFLTTPQGGFVQLWTGERVRATGELPARDATVSLHGTFVTRDVLRVDQLFEHRQDRDWPSYVALHPAWASSGRYRCGPSGVRPEPPTPEEAFGRDTAYPWGGIAETASQVAV